MGWLEWAAQLAVIALLAGTMAVALRLERALRAVRRDRVELANCAAALDDATRGAEAAALRLRRDAEESCKRVGEGLAAAEPLRDDLRYLMERAEAAADRLDGLVRAARDGAPPRAAAAAPRPAESRAERDLLLALARRAS